MRAALLLSCLAAPLLAMSSAAQTAPGPQIGTFGLDETGMDRSVAPGDDFYDYANGSWMRATRIPTDKSNYGAFNALSDVSQQRLHAILDEVRSDPASRIGTLYAGYLDTAAIESRGLSAVRPWLNEISHIDSLKAYAAFAARAERNGVPVPFDSLVTQDQNAPDSYALTLSQSGIGMPDRDFYLSSSERMVATRQAYAKHLARMLALAGEPDAESRANAILTFETRIAQSSWTRAATRDFSKTYNPMTLTQLTRSAPGFDFAAYFAAQGLSADRVIVVQPSAIAGIAAVIAATPLPVLKDQLLVRSLDSFADVLPAAFDNEKFAFFGTALSGTPAQLDRTARAINFTSDALRDDIAKLYVARHFSPATKAVVDRIVINVTAAMDRRIDHLEWMSAETKAKAHRKLAAVVPHIGYPDQWNDYSALKVVPGDAFGNKLRANAWEHDDNIGRLGQPYRRWEWGLAPWVVNAYANYGAVEIVFPAAILQPPFFDAAADPAVNYGGIGAAIASQLARHVDDSGARFDEKGKFADWWTPGDFAAFRARSTSLIAQYDAYEPLPGLHVNGRMTQAENIDDLIGVEVAYQAYRASLGGKPAPVLGGFSGDQRFFLAWAQAWRRTYRESNLRQRLLTDPHAPSAQRAAIVRNLDAWYQAFDVKPGQPLYLAPGDRVHLW